MQGNVYEHPRIRSSLSLKKILTAKIAGRQIYPVANHGLPDERVKIILKNCVLVAYSKTVCSAVLSIK